VGEILTGERLLPSGQVLVALAGAGDESSKTASASGK